jgi:hypothetical protein
MDSRFHGNDEVPHPSPLTPTTSPFPRRACPRESVGRESRYLYKKHHQKQELLKQVLWHKTLKTALKIGHKTIAAPNYPKINTNRNN